MAWGNIPTIDVLDSVTLQQLQTFRPSLSAHIPGGVLGFSPDSRILVYYGIPDGDHEPCVSSWDLQTGGLVSTVRLQGPGPGYDRSNTLPSIVHSASGGIVGVFHWNLGHTDTIDIFVCDVASGTHIRSHSFDNGILLSYDIWTYGESFRFATADTATITIWEVGFTLDATCIEAETLPAPRFAYRAPPEYQVVRPPPYSLHTHTFGDTILLAWGDSEEILVWDVRNLKCLLYCEDARPYGSGSFSSDGRVFACTTRHSTTRIWKESPNGYVPHRILQPGALLNYPLLSPNGESIITFRDLIIKLWRTREISNPPSGTLTQDPRNNKGFLLDFSHDGTLVAVAEEMSDTVTVLTLKSDDPQLTIDVGEDVHGLRVIGNTVVVVGAKKSIIWKVISWNLPAGDCVPDARVDRRDSVQTVDLSGRFSDSPMASAAISSDCRYAALMYTRDGYQTLDICSVSTGECLQTVKTRRGADTNTLWLTPDGSDVWCVANNGKAEVWRVGEAEVRRFSERGEPEGLELAADIEHPPEGYPWRSSRGYRATNDWWILGPDGKRLLMLPPPWQSYPVRRVWKGKFLALLHGGLSKPVILEMEP